MQLMLLLLLAGPPAAAPFDVQVDPSGAVNATVNGVRCLEDFRVLIPAPDWKGGASPRDGIRQDLGPGHVRVSGTMVDQTPCARHDAEGADLAWEVTFTRDYAVETVRLNGLVACDLAAGKGAWLFHRPKKLTWGMLPARYGEPGGYLSDWGFDWFAWALPGGATLRLLPRDGLTGFYQQDGRQWGDARFQGCWVMREKGAVPAGTVLRAGIRLAPLSADELAAEATRAGCSLLAPTATLTPDADGRATWSLGLTSLWPRPRTIRLAWTARDDLGTPLARGQEGLAVAALGSAERRLAVPASPSGDYRLRAELHWSPAAPPEVIEQRQVLARPGPRARLSLDGTWETCPDAAGGDTPPAEAKWTAVQVPGWLPQPARHTWYRRSFDLPPALQGRRLKLCFGAVNHAARVYVNGRLAGSHVGADVPFELDVTDLVRPDANELAVAVTGWTAVCTNPPATFEVKQFEHPGWKIPPGTIIAPIGGDFRSTGIWQSVALEALPAVHLADVFVRTSVRQHRLRVTATVRNEGDGPVTVQLHSRIADAHGPAKELPDGEAALAPGETREVQLSAPWVNPHLWSLDEPHLYRLTTDLSVGGQHVDTLATRFGFREVWTAGSRVMLNGLPLTLFATSTWDAPSWEAARERMARFKAAGVRSVRLHTQPWQPHNLDVADELGLLIVDEAAVYCYAQSYAPTDERFWRAYTEHVQALARRDRNHPSLALYSLENEILSCGGKPAEWEPGLGKLADALRQVDPTRLIFCESDLDPAGKMDLYGMHYPREYWAGYTLYPRKCWWMGQPIDYLGRKWQWKRDKPLYIGEFDGGFPAWYPQYQAFWLGDEAYTSRGRFSVDSVNSRARREMIAQEIAAYRAYGVTGMNPWFDADEVDVFGPVAYAPLTLAVREQTTHFYAGDRVVRTVHVYNDTLRRTRLELRWHAGASTASGSETLDLSPGTVAERRLTFIAPRPRERWTVPFTVELREGARSVKTVKQPLGVYPRPSAPLDASGIGLWDPAGTSTKVLAAHGVAPRPAADPAALPAGLKVLLIGAGALRDGAAPWAASLARFVGEGGRVVCFEQTAYPQDWLPLPVELDAKHSASLAFARPKHHPVLEGVADEDLRFWQPDHLVSAHTLLKPNRGNFAVLVDAGGIRSAIDDLNGLNWAPLLELPFGQGRYLLCQLPLIARADVEPTAEILLRRL
ncbi:MAG: hypothetical protein HYU66_22910, partial [Armatimonadetes bacterium]|nr:hypothetical protein [Armatimonadota bacterium]